MEKSHSGRVLRATYSRKLEVTKLGKDREGRLLTTRPIDKREERTLKMTQALEKRHSATESRILPTTEARLTDRKQR